MCWYITVSVPRGSEAPLLELGKEGSGVRVAPTMNASLAELLPRTDIQLLVTGAGCACDLYRSPDDPSPPDADGPEVLETGLQWALDTRNLTDVDKVTDRVNRRARRRLRETIANLARAPGAVRLFAHCYGGDVSSEVLGGIASVPLSAEHYLAAGGAFPADTVVVIAP
jgi:hypothetical protein